MSNKLIKLNRLEKRKSKKRERNKERFFRKNKNRICFNCGGQMTWCNICNCFSATCCEDYGSCLCC